MNPEPVNTELTKVRSHATDTSEKTVFMGSGFGLEGRPGMTKVISSQTLRSPHRGRLEGRIRPYPAFTH